MDNWQQVEELVVPEPAGEDEEIVTGANVAQVDAAALETLGEVVDDGTEEIVHIEVEQQDALYREVLHLKRRLEEAEHRLSRLEAIIAKLSQE